MNTRSVVSGMATSRSLLCGLAACLLLAIGGVAFSSVASPVDLGKVYSVDQAQSMSEVEGLLGEPSFVGPRREDGTLSWYYRHPLLWHEFRVDFAESGEVIRCVFGD